MKNRILYLTRNTIPYVRELQPLTGSVAGCILMQQLDYWFEHYQDGFWKFLQPCDHPSYKEGKSWCEDLGMSDDEFRTAFDKIGIRYKSKAAFDAAEDKFQGKYYCSYHDRRRNLTYYFRNHDLLDAVLDALIYKKKPDNNPPASSGTGIDSPVNRESRVTVNQDARFTGNQEGQHVETGKLGLQETEKLDLLNTENTGSDITQIPLLLPTVPAQPADTASGSGVFNLIYPKELSKIEKKTVEGMILVGELPLGLQQQLLDELAGAIQAKSIKRGVVPFTHGLISAAKVGKFTPSLGVAVLAKRNTMQEIHSNEAIAQANFVLDPARMSKGEEMIAAARRRAAQIDKPAPSLSC